MNNARYGIMTNKPQPQIYENIMIDRLNAQGAGVGRVQERLVHVAGALAGEIVDIALADEQPPRLVRVVDASPERVAPPCVYYESCGGCSLQHMSDAAYALWKAESALVRVRRAGVVPDVVDDPVFIGARARRRASFVLNMRPDGVVEGGFHRRRSHDMVAIEDCLLLEPEIMARFALLKPLLPRFLRVGRKVDLFLQHVDGQFDALLTGPLAGQGLGDMGMRRAFVELAEKADLARISWQEKRHDPVEVIVERHPVQVRFGDLSVALPPAAFMQPSKAGEDALADAVCAMLDHTYAGRTNLKLADLFCGCGTFTGRLRQRGQVYGAESDPAAVAALQKSDGALKIERKDLFRQPLLAKELNGFDAVVFDPPRAGADMQARQMALSEVPCIIGVSCDPESFARDAAILVKGGYQFARLRIVDQFAWSPHVELVGLFTKKRARPRHRR